MDNDIDRLLAEHSNGRWVTESQEDYILHLQDEVESQEDYILHLQDEVKRLTAENKQLTTDLVALRAQQQAEPMSSLQRYNEIMAEDPEIYTGNALERLRFFCSLSMPEQDWLDVETFFDDVEKELDVCGK